MQERTEYLFEVKDRSEFNRIPSLRKPDCEVNFLLLASKQVNSLVKSVVDKFGSETIKINILANNAGVAFDMNLIRIIPASPYYRLLDNIIFNGAH